MNNSGKTYFQKHFMKIFIEALCNSALCGLMIGFACGFIAALVTWITVLKGIALTLGVTVGVSVIAGVIFYFAKFRPTVVRSARRIDSTGLEERLITMVEYEKDNSPIAEIQRNDAKRALDALSTAAINLRIPKRTPISTGVTFGLCAVMLSLSILSDMGIIPSLPELFEPLIPEEQIKYVSISYEAEDGGNIEGEADQLIEFGSKTEVIEAVPEEGYEFYEWDDGYKKPVRYEKNVEEDKIFVAIFVPLDMEAQPDENGDPSDQDSPQSKPQKSDQQKEDQQKPEEDQESDQQQQPDDKEDKPSHMGGGKYEEVNKIINGEIYYKEVLNDYLELLRERLETEGDNLTNEERAIIEAYLNIV